MPLPLPHGAPTLLIRKRMFEQHALKRAAFEAWRTGYSSAFAVVLFVAVFGLANIYVKALNRVKQR